MKMTKRTLVGWALIVGGAEVLPFGFALGVGSWVPLAAMNIVYVTVAGIIGGVYFLTSK